MSRPACPHNKTIPCEPCVDRSCPDCESPWCPGYGCIGARMDGHWTPVHLRASVAGCAECFEAVEHQSRYCSKRCRQKSSNRTRDAKRRAVRS